jgi:hypothetical protein
MMDKSIDEIRKVIDLDILERLEDDIKMPLLGFYKSDRITEYVITDLSYGEYDIVCVLKYHEPTLSEITKTVVLTQKDFDNYTLFDRKTKIKNILNG